MVKIYQRRLSQFNVCLCGTFCALPLHSTWRRRVSGFSTAFHSASKDGQKDSNRTPCFTRCEEAHFPLRTSRRASGCRLNALIGSDGYRSWKTDHQRKRRGARSSSILANAGGGDSRAFGMVSVGQMMEAWRRCRCSLRRWRDRRAIIDTTFATITPVHHGPSPRVRRSSPHTVLSHSQGAAGGKRSWLEAVESIDRTIGLSVGRTIIHYGHQPSHRSCAKELPRHSRRQTVVMEAMDSIHRTMPLSDVVRVRRTAVAAVA